MLQFFLLNFSGIFNVAQLQQPAKLTRPATNVNVRPRIFPIFLVKLTLNSIKSLCFDVYGIFRVKKCFSSFFFILTLFLPAKLTRGALSHSAAAAGKIDADRRRSLEALVAPLSAVFQAKLAGKYWEISVFSAWRASFLSWFLSFSVLRQRDFSIPKLNCTQKSASQQL